MRQQFVEVKKWKEAKALMPWACQVIRVEGGYMGFESWKEYKIWLTQK